MKTLFLMAWAVSLFGATTIDSGAMMSLEDALVSWLSNSLGYLIALIGMMGTLIYYMIFVTSSGKEKNGMAFIFYGMMISFFAGGVVGIARVMMGLGASSFAG